jgi:hypothetical protein
MVLGKRGVIFVAFCATAFILTIVATPLAFGYIETDRTINDVHGHSEIKYTMWEVCVHQRTTRIGSPTTRTEECSADLDCATEGARAARAFTIISLGILSFLCCGLGIVDILCRLPADPVGKFMLLSASLFAAACVTLSWVLQIALYTNRCSGTSIDDAEGSQLGPAPILMIIASLLCLAAVFTSLHAPGPVGIVKTASCGPVSMVNPYGSVEERPTNPVTRHPYVV